MDRDTAWRIFIDGFIGSAAARRVVSHLAVEPIEGVRFATEQPFDEFFVNGYGVATALAAIRTAQPLAQHYITSLSGSNDPAPGYGAYRYSHREALMVCEPGDLHLPAPAIEVMTVSTAAEAEWLNAHDPQGKRWIPPENLADPNMRHYAVILDGLPVARGCNLLVDELHGSVSRIYTAESYRRRGLARALMLQLLVDQVAHGRRWSVLTASSLGQGVYEALGYRTLGMIHVYEAPGMRNEG